MAKVLDRRVDPAELAPASLPGWRRVRALNASYPVLIPDPEGRVDGVLLQGPSPRDVARIRHFESDEYAPAPVTVRRADGSQTHAVVFLALDAVFETDGEPWDPDAWAVEHKAGFLARCEAWMAGCPEPDSA